MDTAVDDEIYWRILFVGWDYFCRSTFQQLDVLELALRYSSSEIEKSSAKDAEALSQKIA
jgi:hypothetical protein